MQFSNNSASSASSTSASSASSTSASASSVGLNAHPSDAVLDTAALKSKLEYLSRLTDEQVDEVLDQIQKEKTMQSSTSTSIPTSTLSEVKKRIRKLQKKGVNISHKLKKDKKTVKVSNRSKAGRRQDRRELVALRKEANRKKADQLLALKVEKHVLVCAERGLMPKYTNVQEYLARREALRAKKKEEVQASTLKVINIPLTKRRNPLGVQAHPSYRDLCTAAPRKGLAIPQSIRKDSFMRFNIADMKKDFHSEVQMHEIDDSPYFTPWSEEDVMKVVERAIERKREKAFRVFLKSFIKAFTYRREDENIAQEVLIPQGVYTPWALRSAEDRAPVTQPVGLSKAQLAEEAAANGFSSGQGFSKEVADRGNKKVNRRKAIARASRTKNLRLLAVKKKAKSMNKKAKAARKAAAKAAQVFKKPKAKRVRVTPRPLTRSQKLRLERVKQLTLGTQAVAALYKSAIARAAHFESAYADIAYCAEELMSLCGDNLPTAAPTDIPERFLLAARQQVQKHSSEGKGMKMSMSLNVKSTAYNDPSWQVNGKSTCKSIQVSDYSQLTVQQIKQVLAFKAPGIRAYRWYCSNGNEKYCQFFQEAGFRQDPAAPNVWYYDLEANINWLDDAAGEPAVEQLSKLGLKRAIGLRNSATDEKPNEELIKFVLVSAINVPADASSIYDAIDNPVNISHPFSHYDEEYRAYFEEPVHEIEQCNYRQNQEESLGLAVFLQALIQRQPRGNYYKTYLHNLHKDPTLLAGVSEDLLFSDARRTHFNRSWRDRVFNTCICFDRLGGLEEEALEDGGLPGYLARQRKFINNIFFLEPGKKQSQTEFKDAFAKEQVTSELINYQTETFEDAILAKKGQRVFVVLTGTCRKSDIYIAIKSSTGNALADEMFGSKQGQSTQVRIVPKELDVWAVEDPAKAFQTHEMLFSFHPGLFFGSVKANLQQQFCRITQATPTVILAITPEPTPAVTPEPTPELTPETTPEPTPKQKVSKAVCSQLVKEALELHGKAGIPFIGKDGKQKTSKFIENKGTIQESRDYIDSAHTKRVKPVTEISNEKIALETNQQLSEVETQLIEADTNLVAQPSKVQPLQAGITLSKLKDNLGNRKLRDEESQVLALVEYIQSLCGGKNIEPQFFDWSEDQVLELLTQAAGLMNQPRKTPLITVDLNAKSATLSGVEFSFRGKTAFFEGKALERTIAVRSYSLKGNRNTQVRNSKQKVFGSVPVILDANLTTSIGQFVRVFYYYLWMLSVSKLNLRSGLAENLKVFINNSPLLLTADDVFSQAGAFSYGLHRSLKTEQWCELIPLPFTQEFGVFIEMKGQSKDSFIKEVGRNLATSFTYFSPDWKKECRAHMEAHQDLAEEFVGKVELEVDSSYYNFEHIEYVMRKFDHIGYHFSKQFFMEQVAHISLARVEQEHPSLFANFVSRLEAQGKENAIELARKSVVTMTIKASKGLKRITLALAKGAELESPVEVGFFFSDQTEVEEDFTGVPFRCAIASGLVAAPGMAFLIGKTTSPVEAIIRKEVKKTYPLPTKDLSKAVTITIAPSFDDEEVAPQGVRKEGDKYILYLGDYYKRRDYLFTVHTKTVNELVHFEDCEGTVDYVEWKMIENISGEKELEVVYMYHFFDKAIKVRSIMKGMTAGVKPEFILHPLNQKVTAPLDQLQIVLPQDVCKSDTLYGFLSVIANTAFYASDTKAGRELRRLVQEVNTKLGVESKKLVIDRLMLVCQTEVYQPLIDYFVKNFGKAVWFNWQNSKQQGDYLLSLYQNKVEEKLGWLEIKTPAELAEIAEGFRTRVFIDSADYENVETNVLFFAINDAGQVDHYYQRTFTLCGAEGTPVVDVEIYERLTVSEAIATSSGMPICLRSLYYNHLTKVENGLAIAQRMLDEAFPSTLEKATLLAMSKGDHLGCTKVIELHIHQDSQQTYVGIDAEDLEYLRSLCELTEEHTEETFKSVAAALKDVVFVYGGTTFWLPALYSMNKLKSADTTINLSRQFFTNALVPILKNGKVRQLELSRCLGILDSLLASREAKKFLVGLDTNTCKRVSTPEIPAEELWILYSEHPRSVYQQLLPYIPMLGAEGEDVKVHVVRAPLSDGPVLQIKVVYETEEDGELVQQVDGSDSINFYLINDRVIATSTSSCWMDYGDFDGDTIYIGEVDDVIPITTDADSAEMVNHTVGFDVYQPGRVKAYASDHYYIKPWSVVAATLTKLATTIIKEATKTLDQNINYVQSATILQTIGVDYGYKIYQWGDRVYDLVTAFAEASLDVGQNLSALLGSRLVAPLSQLYEIILGGYSEATWRVFERYIKPTAGGQLVINDENLAQFSQDLEEMGVTPKLPKAFQAAFWLSAELFYLESFGHFYREKGEEDITEGRKLEQFILSAALISFELERGKFLGISAYGGSGSDKKVQGHRLALATFLEGLEEDPRLSSTNSLVMYSLLGLMKEYPWLLTNEQVDEEESRLTNEQKNRFLVKLGVPSEEQEKEELESPAPLNKQHESNNITLAVEEEVAVEELSSELPQVIEDIATQLVEPQVEEEANAPLQTKQVTQLPPTNRMKQEKTEINSSVEETVATMEACFNTLKLQIAEQQINAARTEEIARLEAIVAQQAEELARQSSLISKQEKELGRLTNQVERLTEKVNNLESVLPSLERKAKKYDDIKKLIGDNPPDDNGGGGDKPPTPPIQPPSTPPIVKEEPSTSNTYVPPVKKQRRQETETSTPEQKVEVVTASKPKQKVEVVTPPKVEVQEVKVVTPSKVEVQEVKVVTSPKVEIQEVVVSTPAPEQELLKTLCELEQFAQRIFAGAESWVRNAGKKYGYLTASELFWELSEQYGFNLQREICRRLPFGVWVAMTTFTYGDALVDQGEDFIFALSYSNEEALKVSAAYDPDELDMGLFSNENLYAKDGTSPFKLTITAQSIKDYITKKQSTKIADFVEGFSMVVDYLDSKYESFSTYLRDLVLPEKSSTTSVTEEYYSQLAEAFDEAVLGALDTEDLNAALETNSFSLTSIQWDVLCDFFSEGSYDIQKWLEKLPLSEILPLVLKTNSVFDIVCSLEDWEDAKFDLLSLEGKNPTWGQVLGILVNRSGTEDINPEEEFMIHSLQIGSFVENYREGWSGFAGQYEVSYKNANAKNAKLSTVKADLMAYVTPTEGRHDKQLVEEQIIPLLIRVANKGNGGADSNPFSTSPAPSGGSSELEFTPPNAPFSLDPCSVPGIIHNPGFLTEQDQTKVLELVKAATAKTEHTSFKKGGYTYTCLGDYYWIFNSGAPKYLTTQPSGARMVAIPSELKTLVESVVNVLYKGIFPGVYEAQSCLVNTYRGQQTLAAHQDKTEEIDAPIVSLSFGATGLFRAGGKKRNLSDAIDFTIKSGDLLIMYGPERYCFHSYMGAIDTIDTERINLTFRMVRLDTPIAKNEQKQQKIKPTSPSSSSPSERSEEQSTLVVNGIWYPTPKQSYRLKAGVPCQLAHLNRANVKAALDALGEKPPTVSMWIHEIIEGDDFVKEVLHIHVNGLYADGMFAGSRFTYLSNKWLGGIEDDGDLINDFLWKKFGLEKPVRAALEEMLSQADKNLDLVYVYDTRMPINLHELLEEYGFDDEPGSDGYIVRPGEGGDECIIMPSDPRRSNPPSTSPSSPFPSGGTTPNYNEKSPVLESSKSDNMYGDCGYEENPFTEEDVQERIKYLDSIEGQPRPTFQELVAQMNAEGENSEETNEEEQTETNNEDRPEELEYFSEEDWLNDNNETYESLIGRAGKLNFLGQGSNNVQDVVEIDLDELIGSEEQNLEETQQFSYELLNEIDFYATDLDSEEQNLEESQQPSTLNLDLLLNNEIFVQEEEEVDEDEDIAYIRSRYRWEYQNRENPVDDYFDRDIKPKLLSLNPEQRSKVRKIVEGYVNPGIKNYILTGEAGTGKSYTMKVIMLIMHDLRYIPIVTATTNLAASLHDRAVTINNFMKLKLNINKGTTVQELNKKLELSAKSQEARWLYPSGAHGYILYIDEVSMLSAETAIFLNKLIEWKEGEHAMQSTKEMPFEDINRLQILAIGDFKQLEPINGSLLYKDPVISGGTNLADKNFYRRRNFELVRLKTNMRQADDQEYAQILDLISNGVKLSESQELRDFFRREFNKSTKESASTTALNIIFNNEDIDRFNETKLKELFHEKQIVTLQGKLNIARSFGLFQNKSNRKQLVEERIKETKIEEQIRIAVGCPVILKKKVKTQSGETVPNGTRGIVTFIDPKQEFIKIDVDGQIFTIPKVLMEETYINNDGKEVKLYDLRQIPVRLAYALSYSSVQGMTITGDVVVHGYSKVKANNGEDRKIATDVFQNNALYVALSRVTSSKNLYFYTGSANEHSLYYGLLLKSYKTNFETIQWLQSV